MKQFQLVTDDKTALSRSKRLFYVWARNFCRQESYAAGLILPSDPIMYLL
jgi:hypothetical protein